MGARPAKARDAGREDQRYSSGAAAQTETQKGEWGEAVRALEFELPFALESLNIRDKQHWSKRRRRKIALKQQVMAAIGGPRYFPNPTWRKARVTVTRCSAGELDTDNLYASFKNLGDSLIALKIIEDDTPEHLILDMHQSIAPRGKGSTIVRIEPLD